MPDDALAYADRPRRETLAKTFAFSSNIRCDKKGRTGNQVDRNRGDRESRKKVLELGERSLARVGDPGNLLAQRTLCFTLESEK